MQIYEIINVPVNDIFYDFPVDSLVKLPRGYNQYPFSFQLPYNIPCSFEHNVGYVRYTVNAVIDRPWKFNHECKAAFTVVSSLDLNVHREKYVRYQNSFSKCFKNIHISNLQELLYF